VEDFELELRQVGQVPEVRKEEDKMEEDREVRIDEDVEAHSTRNSAKSSAKARNDEGDDVEAHQALNNTKNSTRNRNDEGDDVEGHMLLNHTKNSTKN
jgi:hypothetical protein